MNAPVPPPLRPPSRAKAFSVGLFLGFWLALAGVGAGLYYVNGRLSLGFERGLRRFVFTDDRVAGFEGATLDLWRGRAAVRRLRFQGPGGLQGTVDTVTLSAPVAELFSGSGPVAVLNLERPALRWDGTTEGGAGFHPPAWPLALREWNVTDGSATWTFADAGLTFDRWGLRLVRSDPGTDGRSVLTLDGGGRVLPEDPGAVTVHVTLREPFSAAAIDGEIQVRDLSLPALYRTWGRDPELQILSGRLDVKTQFTVNGDQLTASHLVEIKDLRVDPGAKKKLFGLSVKRLKDVLVVDRLSFVVPMSGSVQDPQIGFATTLEQILSKILDGKIDDPEDLRAWARRGGNYFGAKADAAWRAWLKRRREKPL